MSSPFDYLNIFLFFLLTLIAEILGTLGGFGSSLFFVTLFQFVFAFQSVLVLTGLLHVFSNTAKLFLFWKTIDWKLVLWLGVSSVVLAMIGAYLTSFVNFIYAKILLGVFLLVFSIFFYSKPAFKLRPSLQNSLVGGSIAGFLAGFIGTGGAVRGIVLASFNLERNFFVGTSAAVDFAVDISRTLIYLDSNYLSNSMLIFVPLLFFASLIGSYIGKVVLNRISQKAFKKIVLALIFLMGLLLLVSERASIILYFDFLLS
jgi:uncharacterized membrane protein YfcA